MKDPKQKKAVDDALQGIRKRGFREQLANNKSTGDLLDSEETEYDEEESSEDQQETIEKNTRFVVGVVGKFGHAMTKT